MNRTIDVTIPIESDLSKNSIQLKHTIVDTIEERKFGEVLMEGLDSKEISLVVLINSEDRIDAIQDLLLAFGLDAEITYIE